MRPVVMPDDSELPDGSTVETSSGALWMRVDDAWEDDRPEVWFRGMIADDGYFEGLPGYPATWSQMIRSEGPVRLVPTEDNKTDQPNPDKEEPTP